MAPRKDIDATINRYQNYKVGDGLTVTGSYKHSLAGHAGKWYKAYDVPDGQSDFTGSRASIGAAIVQAHGSAVFHLTGGGEVPALDCELGGLVELSIAKITAASTAKITVFKLNTAR